LKAALFAPVYSLAMLQDYTRAIKSYLATRPRPVGVAEVARAAGITNWGIALAALLELTLEGQIKGIKTSGGWYFQAKEAPTA
jgi:hypothetical protein